MKWVPMGKSVVNLYRYAQVSQSANTWYWDALHAGKLTGECLEEMDICRYQELKQLIKQDYENFISENSIVRFTFSGATSRILKEFFVIIDSSEIEKIMIYTQLALWGLKYNE
jgi:hypothetical protein